MPLSTSLLHYAQTTNNQQNNSINLNVKYNTYLNIQNTTGLCETF